MKRTVVYLDMDGTIADLYNEPNWLENLRNEVNGVFRDLMPLITEEKLFELYPEEEYEIRILSMTPLGATKGYAELVKYEKDLWLAKYFPKLREGQRIYMKYGHNKNLPHCQDKILIDDNEKILESWKGIALFPSWLLA